MAVETFESRSPATGDLIGTFPRSTPDDVGRAVASAKAAYEDWRLVPAPRRGEILFRFAELVRELPIVMGGVIAQHFADPAAVQQWRRALNHVKIHIHRFGHHIAHVSDLALRP